MIIRKEFNVESAHVVRNCTSERCSHSIHGHSAKIEVLLKGDTLDNAQMVYDFGLMKGTIKQFIDSMDHCYLLCNKDRDDFKNFIKSHCDRWIELPFNPSAEMLSIFVHHYVQHILDCTRTSNGEGHIEVIGVRYHETTTGYAQSEKQDVDQYKKTYRGGDIIFSDGVVEDWSQDLKNIIFFDQVVLNPEVKQQINLK